MATNDLTAGEIESPPAAEPDYIVSARIYDSAANSPDKFQAVVTQLDQDIKNGAAPGFKIDYDTQGKVSAITINNENLYSSSDTSIPSQLASDQISADIGSGDIGAALNDTAIITSVFGVTDPAGLKQQVLDGFGSTLGPALANPDQSDVQKYLAQLQQSSGSDQADLLAVLNKAKDVSGLGDRVTIETDPQTGVVAAFKIDGKNLLNAAPQAPDAPAPQAPDAPAPQPSSPPPAEAAAAPAALPPADAPAASPPPDAPPVLAPQLPSDAPPQPVSDAPVANAPTPPVDAPPVNLFNADRSEISPGPAQYAAPPAASLPTGDNTGAGVQPTPADNPGTGVQPTPADNPGTGVQPTPADNPGAVVQPSAIDNPTAAAQRAAAYTKPEAEPDRRERHQYEKELTKVIDHKTESSPVRLGEGYYQVVSRMHKDWSDDRIMRETQRLKDLNDRSDVLRVGQRLPMISKEEKADRIKQSMDRFDQATAEQRQQMIAHVKEQAASCEHEDSAVHHDDTRESPSPYRSKGN